MTNSGSANRTYLMLIVLALIVAMGVMVGRSLRRSAGDDACPRAFPTTELATVLASERGWPAGVPAPRPDDLRPLQDPDDAEACRELRALLPDTLSIGPLAASSAGFYRLGDAYVVSVTPNLTPQEIGAMEQGDFGAERHGATWVFDAGYHLLAIIPD